jgi:8-amino-7-oxononanoate synthase
MSLLERIGSNKTMLRLLSDDRFMNFTNGVMDAKNRFSAARQLAQQALVVLRDGQALPNIDPALDGGDADVVDGSRPRPAPQAGATNGAAAKSVNGANGHAEAEAEADKPAPKPVGPRNTSEADLAQSMAERASLAKVGGKDVFDKCYKFMTADNARAMGVYPFFRPLDFNNGPIAQLEGREVIMLGSNNYLGLTTHPKVREAAKQAIDKYGTSMTGSRLVNGSMRLHEELETKLAAYHGKEAGLVFTTGYQVNLATISALLSNRTSVGVVDKDVHASIYDGMRLAQANKARMVRYKHNDPASLDQALAELEDAEGALVITDGVFSAQGEIANLPGLVEVTKKHKARIFVDDAHGLGVLGPAGRGSPPTSASRTRSTSSAVRSRSPSRRSAAGWWATARSSTTSGTSPSPSSSRRAPLPPASRRRWPLSTSCRRSRGARRSCARTSRTCGPS